MYAHYARESAKDFITHLQTVTPAENFLFLENDTPTSSAPSVTKPDYALDTFLFSYSEVQTWKTCERKHYYAFFQKLAPHTKSHPLNLGTFGHAFVEAYYRAKLNGADSEQAYKAIHSAYKIIAEEQIDSPQNFSALTEAFKIVMMNLQHDPFHDHTVRAVEKTLYTPLTDDLTLASTIDLLLEPNLFVPDFPEYLLVDHKFTGRKWNSAKLMMSTQLDIYAAALWYYGIFVKSKAYNFFDTKTGLNTQESFNTNVWPKQEEILTDLIESAVTIEHNIGDKYYEGEANRCFDSNSCNWCPFLNLCYSEMIQDEVKIEQARSVLIPNDYGYRTKGESVPNAT